MKTAIAAVLAAAVIVVTFLAARRRADKPKPPRCSRFQPEALMFAVIGFVAGVVAAILKLTNQHANAILWLLIIGLIAVAIEALWGWHRCRLLRPPGGA